MPDGEPSVDLFEPELRGRLKEVLGEAALNPVFKTHVRRRTALVRHGASEIEVALDDGFIIAGDERLTLAEVELELKSGHTADLVAFARDLAEEGGLSLQFESKAARGHRLAVAAAEPPQKARPVLLPANSGFDDLVAAVLAASLAHFTANWAALRQSDAPESIHQMRVALRRLRSALTMFRKRVVSPELEDIRARARLIASGLGPARECDVFRHNALAGPFRDQPKRMKAAALLLEAVENRRVESYAAARRLIDSPEATLFVLDLQGLIARRAWRNAIAASDLDLLAAPARDFATEVLDRLRRRALKRGKHLPDMSDEARHDLRIALKNLRYAVEFFGGLFDGGRPLRKTLRRVASLQDDLGAHNDAATAESFIASLGLPPDPEAHFAAGFLLGYGRHATIIANAHLAKRWKEFRRAPRFWT
jgi:inorganic triphosphatase YgiF